MKLNHNNVTDNLEFARDNVMVTMTNLVNDTVDRVTDGTADMGMLRSVLHAAIRAVGAVNPDGCCTITITRHDGDGTPPLNQRRHAYQFNYWECPSFDIVEISTAIADLIDDPSGEPGTAAYFNNLR